MGIGRGEHGTSILCCIKLKGENRVASGKPGRDQGVLFYYIKKVYIFIPKATGTIDEENGLRECGEYWGSRGGDTHCRSIGQRNGKAFSRKQ